MDDRRRKTVHAARRPEERPKDASHSSTFTECTAAMLTLPSFAGPTSARPVTRTVRMRFSVGTGQFETRYFVLYVGWTFDFIPVVWLLRRVTRSAGQTAPPPQGLHATTPVFALDRGVDQSARGRGRRAAELVAPPCASIGLLTGQGEHGLSHPTLEAVVVHELLEQFGIILN